LRIRPAFGVLYVKFDRLPVELDRVLAGNVRDKVKKAHSLSPTSGVLRRIGAIAVEMTSKDGG
jgi:hypothetical protein